jgi:hypothetical protein
MDLITTSEELFAFILQQNEEYVRQHIQIIVEKSIQLNCLPIFYDNFIFYRLIKAYINIFYTRVFDIYERSEMDSYIFESICNIVMPLLILMRNGNACKRIFDLTKKVFKNRSTERFRRYIFLENAATIILIVEAMNLSQYDQLDLLFTIYQLEHHEGNEILAYLENQAIDKEMYKKLLKTPSIYEKYHIYKFNQTIFPLLFRMYHNLNRNWMIQPALNINNEYLTKYIQNNNNILIHNFEYLLQQGFDFLTIKDKLLNKLLESRLTYEFIPIMRYLLENGAIPKDRNRKKKMGDHKVIINFLETHKIITI